jgi:hypothetical protein
MTLNFYAIRFKPRISNRQFAGRIGPTNMICAVLDAVQNQQEYQNNLLVFIFKQKCGTRTLGLGFVWPARPLKVFEFETPAISQSVI